MAATFLHVTSCKGVDNAALVEAELRARIVAAVEASVGTIIVDTRDAERFNGWCTAALPTCLRRVSRELGCSSMCCFTEGSEAEDNGGRLTLPSIPSTSLPSSTVALLQRVASSGFEGGDGSDGPASISPSVAAASLRALAAATAAEVRRQHATSSPARVELLVFAETAQECGLVLRFLAESVVSGELQTEQACSSASRAPTIEVAPVAFVGCFSSLCRVAAAAAAAAAAAVLPGVPPVVAVNAKLPRFEKLVPVRVALLDIVLPLVDSGAPSWATYVNVCWSGTASSCTAAQQQLNDRLAFLAESLGITTIDTEELEPSVGSRGSGEAYEIPLLQRVGEQSDAAHTENVCGSVDNEHDHARKFYFRFLRHHGLLSQPTRPLVLFALDDHETHTLAMFRVALVLLYLGFPDVRVVDGAVPFDFLHLLTRRHARRGQGEQKLAPAAAAAAAADSPIDFESAVVKPRHGLIVDVAQVRDWVVEALRDPEARARAPGWLGVGGAHRRDLLLLDIRSLQEHRGAISGYSYCSARGRIPLSRHGGSGIGCDMRDYRNNTNFDVLMAQYGQQQQRKMTAMTTMTHPESGSGEALDDALADVAAEIAQLCFGLRPRMRQEPTWYTQQLWGLQEAAGELCNRLIVFFCGSGWRASEALFVSIVLGADPSGPSSAPAGLNEHYTATALRGISVTLFSAGFQRWARSSPELVDIGPAS